MTPSILKQLFEVNNRILHQRHEQIFYFLLLLLLFLLLYFFFKAHPSTKRKAGKFTLRGGIKFTEAKNCAIVYLEISYVIVNT